MANVPGRPHANARSGTAAAVVSCTCRPSWTTNRSQRAWPPRNGDRPGACRCGHNATRAGIMIERNERKPYWRHTKVQMLTSLLPFVVAMIVLPLYADALNDKRVLGVPLGYFLVCHGLIVIAF